jgi:hypothetical protein
MRYAIAILCAACVLFGGLIGRQLYPRTVTTKVQVPVVETKTETRTVVRTVTKQPDGTVITREETGTQVKSQTKVSPQPRPDYKVGVLLPIQFDRKPGFQDINVSASRRLFGDVWLEAQYAPKSKEFSLGVSVAL